MGGGINYIPRCQIHNHDHVIIDFVVVNDEKYSGWVIMMQEINPAALAKGISECYSFRDSNEGPASILALRDALANYHGSQSEGKCLSYSDLYIIVDRELLTCARAADIAEDLDCSVDDILGNDEGMKKMMSGLDKDGPRATWYRGLTQ